MELRVVSVDAEVLLEPAAGLHRDGALLNHQVVATCACSEILRATSSTEERSASPFSRGGVPTQIKMTWHCATRVFDPGNELEPLRLLVSLDQVSQARLVEGHPTRLRVRSSLVVVDADNPVANFSQARGGDKPHVAGSDNRNIHKNTVPPPEGSRFPKRNTNIAHSGNSRLEHAGAAPGRRMDPPRGEVREPRGVGLALRRTQKIDERTGNVYANKEQ